MPTPSLLPSAGLFMRTDIEAPVPLIGVAVDVTIATALALAWLELRASEWQDEWQMLAGKARRWPSSQLAARDERAWLDRAREVLATPGH